MCHCYNVTKQAREHDPQGVFIRKYLPELANVPDQFVHEPWKLPERPSSRTSGRRWGSRYPIPIVNDRLTAEASRKVIEMHQQNYYSASGAEEAPDEDAEDSLLQLALQASMADKESPSQVAYASRSALHKAEEAELQEAIAASLAQPLLGA